MATVHKLIDGSKPTWDESAFGASRYGDDTNNSVPSTLAPHAGNRMGAS